jgi:hypothetical protein
MRTPPQDDPFRDLAVERVDRDDGRYLLYYTWPRPTDEEPEPDPRRPAEEPDV